MNTNQKLSTAAILGAGLGSRMQSRAKAKPLTPILGETLLSLLVKSLRLYSFEKISCALRDELLTEEDKKNLPAKDFVDYLYVNTESSLHTMGEVALAQNPLPEHLWITMADTILPAQDLANYLHFCESLQPGESAVLLTSFIDDEKPLYAHISPDDAHITAFAASAQPNMASPLVTSGMYCLSREALLLLPECLAGGMHKMRNFLSFLVSQGLPIKSFVVQKSIDVDHPSDLDKAAAFLKKI